MELSPLFRTLEALLFQWLKRFVKLKIRIKLAVIFL
jgi:hypothetical protein